MRKSKTNHHGAGGSPSPTVHLKFVHPSATAVSVAGSFNDWRAEATPMIPVGDGHWRKELALPPGTFEYRLVVDGQWMPDPSAAETVPNPFGGENSVLRVVVSAG
jgi:1,4-alpha-glucan branching enzyme